MKKNRKKILLLLLLLLVGVITLSSDRWITSLSESLNQQFSVKQYSQTTLKEHRKQTSYYKYDEIQPLTAVQLVKSYIQAKTESVLNAGRLKKNTSNKKDSTPTGDNSRKAVPVVGSISIPSVHIHIPIVKGVTQYYLSLGAGEMRPEEQMGVHNYSLAGHNYNDDKILFSPLRHIQKGNHVYITNGRMVFVYRVAKKYYVSPKEVSVIDEGTKDMVTLITCSMSGKTRLVVQGPLIDQYSYRSSKNNKALWQ